MATPSSLLISSKSLRHMCRASLMSNVVRWSPPTVLGDAFARRALLTSLSLLVWWQFCAPLCRSCGLSSSPLYIYIYIYIYIGEMKRGHKTCIKEHKTATRRGETEKSAEHAWRRHHLILWGETSAPHCSSKRLYTYALMISSWSAEMRVSPFQNAGNQLWTMPWWRAPPTPRHARKLMTEQ